MMPTPSLQRALEGLAAHDEPHAAGPLVDDRGPHGLREVAGAGGLAARVDEPDPPRVAVHDLPAGEVDRVVGRQLVVDERVGATELQRGVAAVVLRQLLLDDVGLDRHPEVVRLPREVGRKGVVGLGGLEGRVAQVAPQDREQPVAVRLGEQRAHLPDLAGALLRAEVDRRADADRAEVDGLADGGEGHLVAPVRVGEQLVVVELDDERDLVGIATGDDAEDAERRGEGAAVGCERQLGEVLRVEVRRVLREARRGRMLDALVDGQDREVAGAAEAAVVEHLLQVAQDRRQAGRSGRGPGRRSRARAA